MEKDRALASRCGSLESKGRQQHEISASNLSQLRISQNLRASGFPGKDLCTKGYSDQKYLNPNHNKNPRITNSHYGINNVNQSSNMTAQSISNNSKIVSTRKTNNFINNASTTGTNSAINMYSGKTGSGKHPQNQSNTNYLNGIVRGNSKKLVDDNNLRFSKVDINKNGAFEFFNSSSDRHLASS